mgnify:CR=1 FL=1
MIGTWNQIRIKWLRYRKMALSIYAALLVFFLLDVLFPIQYERDYATVVYAADSSVLTAYLSPDDKWRMLTDKHEVSDVFVKALLYKEDRYFYYHYGFNPLAMLRAGFNNIVAGKRTSGASTITMQVVRLLEPRKRTYVNKFIEVLRAIQLESCLSKHQILNLYLNLAPYGSNIEGIKAASLFYFGHMPKQISLAQAVTLAIIPNRPNSLNPANLHSLLSARNKWINRYLAAGVFPKQDCEDALKEPLDISRKPAPQKAPHVCYRLAQSQAQNRNIYSTIQPEVQSKAEALVKAYVRRLQGMGISNAAVMVVDNQNNQVVAYVGSADWHNQNAYGQVDGCKAVRSPGSTLKPLLYGLSFDKGLLTPRSLLLDVPYRFDGFSPENYDDTYVGLVSAEQALASSLNVPAVQLLSKMGIKNFSNALVSCGFKQIDKDSRKLGLSMILGGCGARLEELVKLYAGFAHQGVVTDLKFTQEASTALPVSILSDGSAFLITQILTKPGRPDLPRSFENSRNLPRIAWKTGTSYGHRDAWSIGYNASYTIGVWVGNFDGHGVPELVGAEIAAPLLFDLFNSINTRQPKKWFQMPESVDIRYVCPESGLPPESFCSHRVMDYYLPGISPTQKCTHLKYIFVAADESISYCQSCLPANGYKKQLYPDYPPELIAYYNDNSIDYKHIPPHNPQCDKVFDLNRPRIVSLNENAEYFIEKGQEQQLALQSVVNGDVTTVYWYLNDKLFGSCKPSEKLFFVAWPGSIKVSCQDDKGRHTDIFIKVAYY